MDESQRSQIKLRLEHLHVVTSRDIKKAHDQLYAQNGARGIIASGSTVKQSIDLIEEHANRYLESAIEQVVQVVQDHEAYDLLFSHLTTTFRTFEEHKNKAVWHANGGSRGLNSQSVHDASDTRFAEARDLVFQRLQIEKFNFTSDNSNNSDSEPKQASTTTNPGGKPLASHWDAMWAEIAIQLWDGKLIPKKQGDIKAAMFDWLTSQGIEASDTAVTDRARTLWKRWEQEQ